MGGLPEDDRGRIIRGIPPAVRGRMGISSKLFFNIKRHTNVKIPCLIIILKIYSAIQAARTVDFDGVIIFDGIYQVVCMISADIFYAKAVHNKGE